MSSDFQLEEAGLMLQEEQEQFKLCQAVRNMRNGPCAAQVYNPGHHGQVTKQSGPRVGNAGNHTPAALFQTELKTEAHCPEDELPGSLCHSLPQKSQARHTHQPGCPSGVSRLDLEESQGAGEAA